MTAKLEEDQALIQQNNPTLFQTEAWNKAWLATWGRLLQNRPDAQLDSRNDSYQITRRIKGWLPVRTATSIGYSERGVGSIRREYHYADEPSIETQLINTPAERVFSDVIVNSPTYVDIHQLAKKHKLTVLEQDPSTAYSVNTGTSNFETYLKNLGANSRLKLYNRRSRLAQKGEPVLTNLWPDIDGFIQLLNRFHTARWGKPCYQTTNLAFIKKWLMLLHKEGHQINLNMLTVADEPVSVLLDIQVKDRAYNLQSGFLEDYLKGVSLGTLHFGYQIETAFKDPAINAYDFMAGTGKNSNYKQKLATQQCRLVNLVIARAWWLKLLYRLKA